ncbi:MAG TPA: biotin/lipoyl-containing protein, partial [Nonomuraea sp.]|nr:biotin/lipoyl-containing protein [Nonomuraea sp.]
ATHPAVVAGDLDTGLVERVLPGLVPGPAVPGESAVPGAAPVPGEVAAAAGLVFHATPRGEDPWEVTDGWRLGAPAWTTWRLESKDGVHAVQVRGLPEEEAYVLVDGTETGARIGVDGARLSVTIGGRTAHYLHVRDGDTLWLGRGGRAWSFTRHLIGDPGDRPGAAAAGDGVVRSPMPGTVLLVKAQVGERVSAGQPLVIVEAMKMEHTVTAPLDGVVAELPAQPGRSVDMDAVLAVVTADGPSREA